MRCHATSVKMKITETVTVQERKLQTNLHIRPILNPLLVTQKQTLGLKIVRYETWGYMIYKEKKHNIRTFRSRSGGPDSVCFVYTFSR